jgi:hypothetical protein
LELDAEFLRRYGRIFYGQDLSLNRAEELARELSALIDRAGLQTTLPDLEDAPDRFAAALRQTAWTEEPKP